MVLRGLCPVTLCEDYHSLSSRKHSLGLGLKCRGLVWEGSLGQESDGKRDVRQCEMLHYLAGYCFTMSYEETFSNAQLAHLMSWKDTSRQFVWSNSGSGISMKSIKEGKISLQTLPISRFSLVQIQLMKSELLHTFGTVRMPDFIACRVVLHLNPEETEDSETPGRLLTFAEQVIGQLLVVTAQSKMWQPVEFVSDTQFLVRCLMLLALQDTCL